MSNNQLSATDKLLEKYKKSFQPKIFVETYYSKKYTYSYVSNVLGMLHNIFSTHIPEMESMMDLGCGPTIYATISASRKIKRIVSSEFLDSNLEEIRKWVEGKPDAFDWSKYLEEVAKLETEPDTKKLEQRVRNAIQDTVHCDLRLPNPIAPLTEKFDVVFVGLTFGSISTNYEMFARHVSNGANLIKEGGYLIYSGLLHTDYYYVGDVKFNTFYTRKEDVDNALASAKLQTLLWATFPSVEDNNPYCSDYEGSFVVLTKKPNITK